MSVQSTSVQPTSVQVSIEAKLQAAFNPQFAEVLNESHMHSGPANRETHFKLTLVSETFAGVRAVQRHQKIYALLQEELTSGVHALAMHLYTPAEWLARNGESPASPNCLGGSKHDKKTGSENNLGHH